MHKTAEAGLVILFLFYGFSIHAVAVKTHPAIKFVKYACEEYADRMVKLDTNGRMLLPWPDAVHNNLFFSDGVFMSDDETKIITVFLRQNPSVKRLGHTAFIKIFNTADKKWKDLGKEDVDEKVSLVPVKADSSVFSFIKLPKKQAQEIQVEFVTYNIADGKRTSSFIYDQKTLKNRLFYGRYDISGMSIEPKANDYSELISWQKIEKGQKFYKGPVIINVKTGAREEVLRFGNNPCFLRHTGNIFFDFKNRMNFLFGFYNAKAKKQIYILDGNNMIFRHHEKGVGVKEYLGLTRLRAISKNMTSLLFMAEDDFGARIVVIPFDIKALEK